MLNPHHAPTLASLAARVYCGDLPSNRIASATTIPPSTIKSLVSKIPVGLPFDNTAGAETLRVYRAGLASLGHKTKSGIYTSFELRSSIFDACTGKTSCVAAVEIYGVPQSTLKRKIEEVRCALGFATNSVMRAAKSEQ